MRKSTPLGTRNHVVMPVYEEIPIRAVVDNTFIDCKIEDNLAYGPSVMTTAD